jgi:hypothetical protein
MPQGPYSRIVIRRPSGAVEVLGRIGLVDIHATARQMATSGAGTVLAIRHEQMPAEGGEVRTVAIHAMAR